MAFAGTLAVTGLEPFLKLCMAGTLVLALPYILLLVVRSYTRQALYREGLYALYATLMLSALLFLGADTLLWLDGLSTNTYIAVGYVVLFLLTYANIGSFLVPFLIARKFSERRFTRQICTRMTLSLVLYWAGNILLVYWE